MRRLRGNSMKSKIDKEFYLTRGEYAKRVGKSKGSIIQLMRRGKLNNEYIVNNGWYYFRDPLKARAFKETVHGAIYTPKKKYNRGAHSENSPYPNRSFYEHNQMKKLASLQYKVPKHIQDKLPRAIEKIKEEERRQKQSNIHSSISTKNYGGFISNQQLNRDKFTATTKGKIIPKKGPYEI